MSEAEKWTEPPAVDQALMRRVCGHYATGVAIVSTMTDASTPVALTVNSFTSVSLSPPLVSWSLRIDSPNRHHFEKGSAFAISILGERQNDLAMHFARPKDNKFEGIDHRLGSLGAPIVEGGIAHLECRPYRFLEAGDHVIFLWEVVDACQSEDHAPLAFYGGRFHKIAPLVEQLA